MDTCATVTSREYPRPSHTERSLARYLNQIVRKPRERPMFALQVYHALKISVGNQQGIVEYSIYLWYNGEGSNPEYVSA